MTDTASLENCKTLFELTGWNAPIVSMDGPTPRYSLGYLLRKLPENTSIELPSHNNGIWVARCTSVKTLGRAIADTPENAACKLAIELIKQKVITP